MSCPRKYLRHQPILADKKKTGDSFLIRRHDKRDDGIKCQDIEEGTAHAFASDFMMCYREILRHYLNAQLHAIRQHIVDDDIKKSKPQAMVEVRIPRLQEKKTWVLSELMRHSHSDAASADFS